MRSATKTAFRPSLESVEARIVAASGSPAAIHAPAHHAPTAAVRIESHHPAHHPAPHKSASPSAPASTTSSTVTISFPANSTTTSTSTSTPVITPPPKVGEATGAGSQAWVELVNMTGQDLEYQISLAPYKNGQFLPFDISAEGGANVQYQMASLDVGGRRVQPNFQIQFGNGPVTSLMTGISQKAAQGYYIFLDGNGQDYLVPFSEPTASY